MRLDQIGGAGVLVAAVAAPCCFPIFAATATVLGLGVLGRYDTVVLYVLQVFTLLSLLGLAMAFRNHRNVGPLALGLVSVGALAFTFYHSFLTETLYGGLFGLFAATIWNYFCFPSQKLRLRSIITCPKCGQSTEETMPTNACVFFYDCPTCHAQLKPQEGDCCVFCSYGSVPCPPIQTGEACCA